MARGYLFPILAVACLAVSAFIPTAAYASPRQILSYGLDLMARASPPLTASEPLRLSARLMPSMRVRGMPAAERSGARVSMLNGPILAPVRGFEIHLHA